MSSTDWIVLCGVTGFIMVYGMWKSRKSNDLESYLRDSTMPWYAVGLSIMATQASAITFLSAPGQAYTDGMRFVQFYFGLPIAMIILSITAVPIYHRLKIYTAYEYLETRFDLKTRSLAAFLFLIQRGLAAGLTIYAPSIILSCLLGWNIYWTNVFIGGLVIIYTVSGGTRAVSFTHLGQMAVILGGMLIAGIILVNMLPEDISFMDAVRVAGKAGKLNVIDFEFDPANKYNVWSGLIGGLFLALSYFGTDQSQVARYLSGSSVTQSRLGLLFNGMVKIPMQFSILFIGALLFVFYIFERPPLCFNPVETKKIYQSEYAPLYHSLEEGHSILQNEKEKTVRTMIAALHSGDTKTVDESADQLREIETGTKSLRQSAIKIIGENDPLADKNDVNYIFLSYVINYLPAGMIGLLIAVIFAASMSSTSAELNALASTTVIDIYKRSINKNGDEKHYLKASRWLTFFWGVYAIGVAGFATQMGSLIEAVNVLGSLFYGTILGIFLAGFYLKKISGKSVFYAALISEAVVIILYYFDAAAYLWFNLLGCVLVIGIALLIEKIPGNGKEKNRIQ